MKTLKITLAVVAVSLLTFSGVTSNDDVTNRDEPTFTQQPKNIDLLAHRKSKLKIMTQG